MSAAPRARRLLLVLLAVSWAVMLALVWKAFWTLPSPELLRQQRMVQPPTLLSLGWTAGVSALELAALAALLWPGWRRLYRTRVLAAGLGALAWFVFTTPLGITSIQRVHRAWLAGAGAALVLVAVVAALARAAGWAWRRARGG